MPTKTKKERNEKRKEDVKKLQNNIAEGIKKLRSSEGWLEYLKVQSSFHDYSFGNCLLILKQRPNASRVAGFRAWTKLDRQVQKGEKSIRILAPMVKKDKDEDQECFFFRAVSVFDISQTEGKPLPRLQTDCVRADNPESLLWRLQSFIAEGKHKCPLTFEPDTGNALGYYSPSEHRIVINSDLDATKQATTLAHEIAHSMMHRKDAELKSNHGTSFKELEAESVAYIVATHFGFEMGNNSFGYILRYHAAEEKLEQNLKESGSRIAKAAKTIIAGINAQ